MELHTCHGFCKESRFTKGQLVKIDPAAYGGPSWGDWKQDTLMVAEFHPPKLYDNGTVMVPAGYTVLSEKQNRFAFFRCDNIVSL